MKYFFAIIIIYHLSVLPGCRQMYEGFKTVGLEDCYSLPYPEQEECLRQTDVRYDEYERERKEARRR